MAGKLFGKLVVEGNIELLSGLHIGAGRETMEIGGVDSPVVRDPVTREPYIPGSSLKGKMRSLLERYMFAQAEGLAVGSYFNKVMKSGGLEIRHHECSDPLCPVCRLFGASSGNGVAENRPALLYFTDAHLTAESKELLESVDTGLYLTELKFENALDRITSAASPRQIERVPRGSKFAFKLIYNQDLPVDSEEFKVDLQSLRTSLLLLNDDGLGGSVSRGYGRISIGGLIIRYRPRAYYEGLHEVERVFKQDSQTLSEFLDEVVRQLAVQEA